MHPLRTILLICALHAQPAVSETGSNAFHSDHPDSLIDNGSTICIIGDSGTGDNNAIAVARALETMHCSQVRILGDVIYPSGIDSADDPKLELRLLKPYRYFFEHNIKIFPVLGNHDHKSNADAWLDVGKTNPSIHFPNFYYSDAWDGICFFNLDTSYYEKIYFLTERHPQTEWLRQAFAAQAKQCRFSIATGHHPYRSSGGHGDAEWLLAWFFKEELIGKVDLYLAGHDHILADEGVADGTHLLISGSAGLRGRLKEPSADKRFATSKHGFITLQFNRNADGTIVGLYKFYTLEPDGKGGYTDLEEAWQGRIIGQGIRIESVD